VHSRSITKDGPTIVGASGDLPTDESNNIAVGKLWDPQLNIVLNPQLPPIDGSAIGGGQEEVPDIIGLDIEIRGKGSDPYKLERTIGMHRLRIERTTELFSPGDLLHNITIGRELLFREGGGVGSVIIRSQDTRSGS
jgi:hypothetical protein